jgi:DNA-directed RNA polymerase subunit RPC12/RpoP
MFYSCLLCGERLNWMPHTQTMTYETHLCYACQHEFHLEERNKQGQEQRTTDSALQ